MLARVLFELGPLGAWHKVLVIDLVVNGLNVGLLPCGSCGNAYDLLVPILKVVKIPKEHVEGAIIEDDNELV